MVAVRSTLEMMGAQFAGAVCPEDVFGSLGIDASRQDAALKARYRDLVRACHPDLAAAGDTALATRVFQELTRWEGVARKKIDAGTYGDNEPYRAPATPAAYAPTELTVRGKALRLTGRHGEGIFASVHAAEYEGAAAGQAAFAKIARDPQDNDLLEREYRVLKVFQRPDEDPQAERDFFSKQRVYVPSPLTSFSLRDEDGARHQANVMAVPQGQSYTAETLRREKFVGGVEPRHVWWIFRRLLLTAWMAHLRGYVHGGITPDHLLVYPEAHGIVLLDWTCAAKIEEEPVPAINPAFEGFYAPEVLQKELAMPSSDIFAAAATAVYILGGDPARRDVPGGLPAGVRDTLLDCLNPVARRRPQDAESFHRDFGKLLGPRAYAEMVVP